MLLEDNERFMIIMNAIQQYVPEENDIGILIVQLVSNQINNSVNKQFTTQDIYDEIEECFNYYNDFVTEKKIGLKIIEEGYYELVKEYLNMIVEEIK